MGVGRNQVKSVWLTRVCFFLIKKHKISKNSTDGNDIIVKVGGAIMNALHENVVAFHATDGMLDGDPRLTNGAIVRLWGCHEHWAGLRRLLRSFLWGSRMCVHI